ncbi:MAG: glycoside hydrolase family protein [Candidatus Puniceispirillaceae bacterium]
MLSIISHSPCGHNLPVRTWAGYQIDRIEILVIRLSIFACKHDMTSPEQFSQLEPSDTTILSIAQMLVRTHEGVTVYPYEDTVGKITIGVGRNLSDRGLEADEIETLFATDCQIAETALDAWWPDWREAPASVQIALYSMAYNLGLPRLASFVKMRHALGRHDYAQAAKDALDSEWAGQVGRRAEDIAALLAGDYRCLEQIV